MTDRMTYLTDPESSTQPPRRFRADHCCWSYDGYKHMPDGRLSADSTHPHGDVFCDQTTLFAYVGADMLESAWQGYNSTLVAYGQTDSGKSWSLFGEGANKGIVSQFCDKLFEGVNDKNEPEVEYGVTLSMLEIYMEEVRDLLASKAAPHDGLRVSPHSRRGFYVPGVKTAAVGCREEVEQQIEQGTRNRAVAAMKMNVASSHTHIVIGITLVQRYKNAAREETTKTSVVNFVDLAGSENLEASVTGDDCLKECPAVYQSLSTLAECIMTLAYFGKSCTVPYKNSVLTKLLMNTLTGNSKIVAIATVSPAATDYDVTLATLNFVKSLTQVRCSAIINEYPTAKLMSKIARENEKLKAMLASGNIVLPGGSDNKRVVETDNLSDEKKKLMMEELRAECNALLADNKRELKEMKFRFEDKLNQSRAEANKSRANWNDLHTLMAECCYITNVNRDAQLCGKIVHLLDVEKQTVGSNSRKKCDIMLTGPGMETEHAVIIREGEIYNLNLLCPGARVLCNGHQLTGTTELRHNDRIIFGIAQYFVFIDPKQRGTVSVSPGTSNYTDMQQDICTYSGLDMDTANVYKEEMDLQAEMCELLPAIEEANAMSAELDTKKIFEMRAVSATARTDLNDSRKIYVRVLDIETELEWMWPTRVFLNRKLKMQQMYNKYIDHRTWPMEKLFEAFHRVSVRQQIYSKEEDPFEEDTTRDVHIGSVKVWLKNLAYMIDSQQELPIIGYTDEDVGWINIECIPCDAAGREYTNQNEIFITDPDSLVGKQLHFIAKINNATGLPKRFTAAFARFQFYTRKEYLCTNRGEHTADPQWNFSKLFHFAPVTEQLLSYIQCSAVMVEIWAKQLMPETIRDINTKRYLQQLVHTRGSGGAVGVITRPAFRTYVDLETAAKLAMDNFTAQKRVERLDAKLALIKTVVEVAEDNKAKKIPTSVIKSLLYAPTNDVAGECFEWAVKGSESDGSSDSEHKEIENTMDNKQRVDESKSSTCRLL